MLSETLFYPDTRIFKAVLWTYLKTRAELAGIVNISQDHPKTANDIQDGKSRIVLSPAGNPKGRYLTRSLSEPSIRFTAYSVNEASCDNAIFQLQNALESWLPENFLMEGQRLQFLNIANCIETLYSDAINLYFASVIYKFYLSR